MERRMFWIQYWECKHEHREQKTSLKKKCGTPKNKMWCGQRQTSLSYIWKSTILPKDNTKHQTESRDRKTEDEKPTKRNLSRNPKSTESLLWKFWSNVTSVDPKLLSLKRCLRNNYKKTSSRKSFSDFLWTNWTLHKNFPRVEFVVRGKLKKQVVEAPHFGHLGSMELQAAA